MNRVDLLGRIVSDITTFGNGDNTGINFTLVTSEPKLRDGKKILNEKGYPETYDEFHNIVVYGGSARAIVEHKAKGDKLFLEGSIRKSVKEADDGTKKYYYNIVARDVTFI